MKKKSTLISAAALAAALVLVPQAAMAAPFVEDDIIIGDQTNGSLWDITNSGGLGHSYFYVNGVTYDRVVCSEGLGALSVENEIFQPDGDGLDQITESGTGDIVISGNGTFPGVDFNVAAEYRIYAEGDLVRSSHVLTNNTDAPITFTPSVYEDPSDNYSDFATSSSGDNVADLTDRWYSTFDSVYDLADENEPSAVYTKFWGKNPVNLNSFTFNNDQNSDDVEFADVTVAPGKSYAWIVYFSYKTYALSTNSDLATAQAADVASAQAAGAAAVSEFRSNGSQLPSSGRLVRGLDLSIASNWAPAAATLANTGSESAALAATGLFAVLSGIASVMVARRKKNA
jgi:LPXTG-motif cell wall-anchored protein